MPTPASNNTIARLPAASRWLAPQLAFVAGFVDATGFMLLGGLFLAHVTGNFVVLGAQLSRGGETATLEKLSVLPIYIVGVTLAWVVQRRFTRMPLLALAATEASLLLAAAICAIAIERAGASAGALRWSLIAFGVLAMGVQAMLGRAAKLPMTTVMTGNVTQVTADALDRLAGISKTGVSVAAGVTLVMAFAVGAGASGIGLFFAGPVVMAAPATLLLVVCLQLAWHRVDGT
jgi:uncharacterized membrane protein YoaK (UPF0700 family)